MNVNVNLSNIDIILRTVNEKDFIVLNRSTINLYNNNVVIESDNDKHSLVYLMDKFQQYDEYGLVQSRKRGTIHLLSKDFIIVLHSPIIERLNFEDSNRLKLNIIADYIEQFVEPNTYIRKAKLEKIMSNIKWMEKK